MPLNGPPERRRLTPATRRVWQILREVRGQARSHRQGSSLSQRCGLNDSAPTGTVPPATAFPPRQKHARRRAAPILTVGASPAREPAAETSRAIRWQHARPPVSACSFSGIKDQRRAQKNDLRHFSERGYRGPARVSRRTSRRRAGAGQNLQSKAVGVFQRGFGGKPAPTFRTGASPWGAAPRGCRSICRAAHRHWGPCSATDSPRPARRTPARPAPSATPPAAATSARQCG